MKIISLFSGCGGLDLGFENVGFKIIFANDVDEDIWETFEKNHHLEIDKRSIVDIPSAEIPDADGIIGGPPCQSWSLAGEMRGAKDERGQLFYEYVRILKEKQPSFFVAENVPGILSRTHLPEFIRILRRFSDIGYSINYATLDARDYGVPQERRRVVIVGYHKRLRKRFEFPRPTHSKVATVTLDHGKLKEWVTLKDALGDLPVALPAQVKNKPNENLAIPNHEYMNGGFSTIFMSRNRKKDWCDQSFTIQAGGRHAPLHPDSTRMKKIGEDEWVFDSGSPKFRRLSVRECARIQTFPDTFIFYYRNVADGYKMVGNAVPVKLAEAIAAKIIDDLMPASKKKISADRKRKAKRA